MINSSFASQSNVAQPGARQWLCIVAVLFMLSACGGIVGEHTDLPAQLIGVVAGLAALSVHDLAAGRAHKCRHDSEQRRFACAVGPQQRAQTTGAQGEVDVGQCPVMPEALG